MRTLKEEAIKRGDRKKPPLDFEVIDPTTWQGKPIPEREWFVKGMIPSRTVTNLSGDGGSGKTLLALQLIASCAFRLPWLGMPVAAGPCLYYGAEDEAAELHMRLAVIAKAEGRQLADLHGVRLISMAERDAVLAEPVGKTNKMTPTALFKRLIEEAVSLRPKLIVVDPVADLFGGNEIDRGQVRAFVSMLRTLAIQLDCAVLMLSHPSMTGLMQRTGSSGSTAWRNSVRSRLYLEVPEQNGKPHPTKRTVIVNKGNHSGLVGTEIALCWDSGRYVIDTPDDPAVVALKQKATEKLFLRLLAEFTARGINLGMASGTSYAPAKMINDDAARGATKEELAAAMLRLHKAGTIRVEPNQRGNMRLVIVS